MSQCRTPDKEVACYTDAAGVRQNVWQHTIYDSNGAPVATYVTDETLAVIDTSAGTLSPGQCPVAAPDVEWCKLCDVLADGTVVEFFRRTITSFDASGAVIDPVQVDDFEADKVTEYTVQGTVGDCDTCPVEAPLGLITDLSALSA